MPSNKALLASLLDPSPEQVAKGEDDLASFRRHPEFRAVVGLS